MFCARENGANIFYRSANYKLINVTIIQLFVLSKIPNLTKIKMVCLVCLGVSLCRVLKSYQCRQVKLFKNIRLSASDLLALTVALARILALKR